MESVSYCNARIYIPIILWIQSHMLHLVTYMVSHDYAGSIWITKLAFLSHAHTMLAIMGNLGFLAY